MFGYVVAAACVFAGYAMPNMTSSAKPLITIAPTFLFRIIFPPEIFVSRGNALARSVLSLHHLPSSAGLGLRLSC
jgi:hypothetical protein